MATYRNNRSHSLRRCVIASSLCLLAPSLACADDGSESAELPIVLTASRMHQPVSEAPAAITVIDRTMIQASGVRQVADLLRFVPGAVVGYNDGNWPVATLRGLSSTYASGLQVLIDGVSVYSPIFGGMFWAELPLSVDDIERIEVVRGPNAASYGANSFQGVVNIITRDSVTDPSTALRMNIGNNNIHDGSAQFSVAQDEWHHRFTVGQRADDGFNTRPDSQRLRYANLKSNYQVDAGDNIDLSFRWADKNKQIGTYSNTDPTFIAHNQTGGNAQFQTRWNHATSTDNEWWVQFYHQQVNQRERFPVDLRSISGLPYSLSLPFEYEIDYLSHRDGIEFQSGSRWSDQIRSVWGLEARRDAVRSGRLFGTNDEVTEFLTRAFANVEWRFAEKWIFDAGTMFERNSIATNGWSPRIALIHEFAPGHSLRASVSHALRSPTLGEKRSNYTVTIPVIVPPFSVTLPLLTASGNVDSEKVRSDELGYVFSFPELALNGDARWFSDRYHGLVEYAGMINLVTGNDAVNMDNAKITGFDLTLQWNPLTDTSFRLAIGHSNINSNDKKYGKSVPQDTLSLLLIKTFTNGWSGSANYQRVSSMYWTDAGQHGLSIPAIDHLNLKVAKSIPFGHYSTEIAIVIQNALGHYRDYYLGNSAGTPDNVVQRVSYLQVKFDY